MLTAATSSCLRSAFCLKLLTRWPISGQQGLVSALSGSVRFFAEFLSPLSSGGGDKTCLGCF